MSYCIIKENLDLIEEAARGDIRAINALGVATAGAAVSALEMSDFLKSIYENADPDTDPIGANNLLDNFEANKEKVLAGI